MYDGNDDIDRDAWEFMKWFPHVWSEDRKIRYIATNQDEMGDIFFATVNLARWYKIDAEQALLGANKKFTKRFKKMEELKTKPFEEYSFEEFNDLWKKAKIEIDKG